jgi:hypothetical protein
MKIESVYFNNLGYVQSKVSSATLEELKQEAKFILENSNQFKKHNKELVGNLEKEYSTHKSEEILKPYLISLANEFHKQSTELVPPEFIPTNEHYPHWEVKDIWINYQKKYEHNPLHNHSGNLSFALWVQIPYNLEDELSHPNCIDSNTPSNSLFEFVCTDFMGRIVQNRIEVDKSYEGCIIMFPSSLHHMVHPFYTSDDYRISIAGNLVASAPKNIISYQ